MLNGENLNNSKCFGPVLNLEEYVRKDWWNQIFNKFGEDCLVLIMKFDDNERVCSYTSNILKQASVMLVED